MIFKHEKEYRNKKREYKYLGVKDVHTIFLIIKNTNFIFKKKIIMPLIIYMPNGI